MRIIKPTKVQLFNHLKADALTSPRSLTYEERNVIKGTSTFKELKDELVHLANKFYCLRKQKDTTCKWYLGERYFDDANVIENTLHAIHSIAERMHYNIYSQNGHWYIESY